MPNQATRYTTYERAHNTVHIGEKVINKSIISDFVTVVLISNFTGVHRYYTNRVNLSQDFVP